MATKKKTTQSKTTPKKITKPKFKTAYVDGFIIPVPKNKVNQYRKIAAGACKVWMKYGALNYIEAVGDDLNSKFGLSFPKLVKPKKGETIFFSYITYKSKAHRDSVNKKVMQDPEITASMNKKMPFDSKRMSYGGFKVLVSN